MKNKAFHFLYLILEKVNNNSEVSKSRQLKDKVTKHSPDVDSVLNSLAHCSSIKCFELNLTLFLENMLY